MTSLIHVPLLSNFFSYIAELIFRTKKELELLCFVHNKVSSFKLAKPHYPNTNASLSTTISIL